MNEKNRLNPLTAITIDELESAKLPLFEEIDDALKSLVNAVEVYCPDFIHGQSKKQFLKRFDVLFNDLRFFNDGHCSEKELPCNLIYDCFYSIAKANQGDNLYTQFINDAFNECVNRANGFYNK